MKIVVSGTNSEILFESLRVGQFFAYRYGKNEELLGQKIAEKSFLNWGYLSLPASFGSYYDWISSNRTITKVFENLAIS
jgi:hypothetical protein